jgi:hypothetical protein
MFGTIGNWYKLTFDIVQPTGTGWSVKVGCFGAIPMQIGSRLDGFKAGAGSYEYFFQAVNGGSPVTAGDALTFWGYGSSGGNLFGIDNVSLVEATATVTRKVPHWLNGMIHPSSENYTGATSSTPVKGYIS